MEIKNATSDFGHFTVTTNCRVCFYGMVSVSYGENGAEIHGPCPFCTGAEKRIKDIALPNGASFVTNNRIKGKWKISTDKWTRDGKPFIAVEVKREIYSLTTAEVEKMRTEIIEVANG